MNDARDFKSLESLQAPPGLRGDIILDTIGLYCPIPIIRTAEKIKTLSTGQVLEILSDDRVILIDMPAWCLSTGHAYLGFAQQETGWRLYVRKK